MPTSMTLRVLVAPAGRSTSPGRRLSVTTALLLLLVAAATGCSGERPRLVDAASAGGSTVPPLAGAEVTDPTIERGDCAAGSGAEVQVLEIGAGMATVRCLAVAEHQPVGLANSGTAPAEVSVGGVAETVAAGATSVTAAAGTILQPGPNPVTVDGVSGPTIWLVERAAQTLVDPIVGLTDVGPIELGFEPAEVTAAAGGVPVEPSTQPCHLTGLIGDPYTPRFTFRDGILDTIEVTSPGATTRSGIGLGASAADVVAAYGEQVQPQADPGGSPERSLLVFVPTSEEDQAHRLVFVLEADRVVAIRIVSAANVITGPACTG